MSSTPDLAILNTRKGYGVELVHVRCDRPFSCERNSLADHMVFAQLSGPVSTTTRFGSRRLRHRPGRRSIGIAPAGTECGVEIDGPIESIAVSIPAECLALAASQTLRHGRPLVERLSGEDDALFDVILALDAGSRSALSWSTAADALIRRLAEGHLGLGASALPAGAIDAPTVKRLDDYVRAHLTSPLDLPSLAAVAGCDRFRFARGFRAATGLTPHRYVMRLRLQRARDLLQEGTLPLVDVALAAGFCDQSHMSRWVRRVYGVTPGTMFARRG